MDWAVRYSVGSLPATEQATRHASTPDQRAVQGKPESLRFRVISGGSRFRNVSFGDSGDLESRMSFTVKHEILIVSTNRVIRIGRTFLFGE